MAQSADFHCADFFALIGDIRKFRGLASAVLSQKILTFLARYRHAGEKGVPDALREEMEKAVIGYLLQDDRFIVSILYKDSERKYLRNFNEILEDLKCVKEIFTSTKETVCEELYHSPFYSGGILRVIGNDLLRNYADGISSEAGNQKMLLLNAIAESIYGENAILRIRGDLADWRHQTEAAIDFLLKNVKEGEGIREVLVDRCLIVQLVRAGGNAAKLLAEHFINMVGICAIDKH